MAGRRIAVIGAHPDDELLGGGGTFARHVREQDEVHAIVVADGAGSRYPQELVGVLEKQALQAAEVIGFSSLDFLGFPDQRLDTIPLIDLTQRLEAALDDVDPEVVYTHFPGDVNADHGLVAKAAWTACRPWSRPRLRRFAIFETPSSTEWAWPLADGQLKPNLFVDITETLDVKIAAMEC
jgi:LmbE family N-acetylglucosaminyl deacetylase